MKECSYCGFNKNPDEVDKCESCNQPLNLGYDPDSLQKGVVLNTKYEIEKRIGKGGFGIVYLAKDKLHNKEVIIKELFLSNTCRRNHTHSSGLTVSLLDEKKSKSFNTYKEKMLEECKYLIKLNNKNIVKVYDYFEANGTAYMVMEYIEGQTLSSYIKSKKRLPEDEAFEIFSSIANGLRDVHNGSFLHRDIKPLNIMITKNKEIKIIDFGTVKEYDSVSVELTQIVSEGYTPIEVNYGKFKVTPAYDIYSLGMTLFAMLTGKEDRITAPIGRKRDDDVVKMINTLNLKEENKEILLKCIEIEPEDRCQSVEIFVKEEIDNIKRDKEIEYLKEMILMAGIDKIISQEEINMIQSKAEILDNSEVMRLIEDSVKINGWKIEDKKEDIKKEKSNKNKWISIILLVLGVIISLKVYSQMEIKEEEQRKVTEETNKVLKSNKLITQQWLDVPMGVCQRNDGKTFSDGVCQSSWENANEMCIELGARLPEIQELLKIIEACGGKKDDIDSNKHNNSYKKCVKDIGFELESNYWSITNHNDKSNAMFINYEKGNVFHNEKSYMYSIYCIKN